MKMRGNKKERAENRVILLLSGAALIWCILFLSVPLLLNGNDSQRTAGAVLKLFFKPVCHQIPGRCLEIGGAAMAVCGRCAGIYMGFAAGLAFYPLLKKKLSGYGPRLLAAAAVAPACLEAVSDKILGVDAGNWTRFSTGLWLGGFLAWVLAPAVLDAIKDFKKHEAAI
ncbi:DUF2085 domain-containing protein [bacterium]|nr:DUF2085 domain-containing protein [bacterium]